MSWRTASELCCTSVNTWTMCAQPRSCIPPFFLFSLLVFCVAKCRKCMLSEIQAHLGCIGLQPTQRGACLPLPCWLTPTSTPSLFLPCFIPPLLPPYHLLLITPDIILFPSPWPLASASHPSLSSRYQASSKSSCIHCSSALYTPFLSLF